MARNENSSHYTKLSQRLTGWTSNLLLTAVVLVVAIVGGRELITWWVGDSGASPVSELSPTASWETPRDSYQLEFGDSPYRFQRDRVEGDRDEALELLSIRCRETLELQPNPPADIGDAELKMLESINSIEPIDQSPGVWRLFHSEGPMPMLIGVRDDCKIEKTDKDNESSHVQSRMVVWGLAVPEGENVWNTYVCKTPDRTESDNPHKQKSRVDDIVLPLNARKTLGIAGEDGTRIVGFVGGQQQQIVNHYDQEASEFGWKPVGVWQVSSRSCSAEFTRESPTPSRMEIQINIDEQQRVSGLITVVPEQNGDIVEDQSQEKTN